jgi:DNA polymerase-1
MTILKKDAEKIVVIDAHALIHRAYHAMPNLFAKGGIPSGAIFGLTNILLGIIEDIKPDKIIAAFDLPKETFRSQIFKDYKAHRKEGDNNLIEQIKMSPRVFEDFGIPMVSKEGYEADDLIGTFVKKTATPIFSNEKITPSKEGEQEQQIIIVTGDMDIMQLIEKNDIVVYTAKRTDASVEENLFNEKKVFEKYSIWPKQIPDYKGLRGDTSDNIPGIKGIGEKTAIEILKDGKKLEDVYKIVKEFNLQNSNEGVPLSTGEGLGERVKNKKVKVEYPFGISERMFELLKNGEEEAEFSKILGTINSDVKYDFPILKKYDFENHKQKVVELCDEFNFKSIKNKLVGKTLSIGEAKHEAVHVSSDSERERVVLENPEQLPRQNLSDFATPSKKRESEHPKIEQILENVFDTETLKKAQIAIWILNSEETHAEASRILHLTQSKTGEEALKFLEAEIKKQNLENIYNLELSIIPILDKMHENGIVVDREKLQGILQRSEKEKEILVKEIYKQAGREFNINSPKQMKEILFEDLKIEAKQKKTAKGNVSVNAEVLEKMKDLHPIISHILKYREVEKSINTYLEPLLMHSSFDGKIHTTFSIPSSNTGRLSSLNPNMQNIPIRGENGGELRSCFIASPGYVLLSADYSQIELRVAAILSGDEYLEKTFKEEKDVHTMVAANMFSVAENEVTKDMRRAAKAMNFGIIYGMGVNSIKEDLQIDRKQAQEFYDSYTKTVWTLMKYLKSTIEKAKQVGYTETLFGRRTKISALFSGLPFIRAAGERAAMNAPIQGSATGDIIKYALLDFQKVIEKNNLQETVKPILQIHDELLYEVKEEKVNEVAELLKNTMQNVLEKHKNEIAETYKNNNLKIPLLVNVKWGNSWGI